MSSLWWLQQGWTETRCAKCGVKIWPEGDPDWGLCEQHFTELLQEELQGPMPWCDHCECYHHSTARCIVKEERK